MVLATLTAPAVGFKTKIDKRLFQSRLNDALAELCESDALSLTLFIREIPTKWYFQHAFVFFGLPYFLDVFAVPWESEKSDIDCILYLNVIKFVYNRFQYDISLPQ